MNFQEKTILTLKLFQKNKTSAVRLPNSGSSSNSIRNPTTNLSPITSTLSITNSTINTPNKTFISNTNNNFIINENQFDFSEGNLTCKKSNLTIIDKYKKTIDLIRTVFPEEHVFKVYSLISEWINKHKKDSDVDKITNPFHHFLNEIYNKIYIKGIRKDSFLNLLNCSKLGKTENLDEEKKSCVVCKDNFKVGCKVIFLPTCAHMFHVQCILGWLEKNNTCPICISDVTSFLLNDVSNQLLEEIFI